jgi:APA family basic amino acid/polyamine antiporter
MKSVTPNDIHKMNQKKELSKAVTRLQTILQHQVPGPIMPLKPVLGPIQLIFYSVGVIIGAGVYSVIGAAASLAQQGLWLSFVVGALVAILTAFSYAEMTTAFPHAGAEYIYLRRALPGQRFAAFAVGMIIVTGGAATATTVAVAFGGYLKQFIDVPVVLSAFFLLAACTLLNVWGLHESSFANIIFTSIEVAGLLIVVAAGLTHGDLVAPVLAPLHPGIMPAAAIIFFVYLGFEEIANMAEEVRHPARDLPRAIFGSIGITTLLYVLVSLSVVALASPGELAASEAPLALIIHKVWPGASGMLSTIALFATANTVLISLIATSRLAFSMGRDGEIPSIFSAVLPNRGTPWTAALLIFLIAAVLLPIGDLKILAELSSFSALLAFLAVNVALIILRYRIPAHRRPFRVPFNIGRMPLIPIGAIGAIGFLLLYFDWKIYMIAALVLALLALIFSLQPGARAPQKD